MEIKKKIQGDLSESNPKLRLYIECVHLRLLMLPLGYAFQSPVYSLVCMFDSA